jgi:hypothetical protein
MADSNEVVGAVTAEVKASIKVSFKVEENYVKEGEDCLFCRDVQIEGEEYEDSMGNTRYNLVRKDTGERVYPALLNRHIELSGDREYMAVSSYGGWGKGTDVQTALKNMMQACGFTKTSVKKFDVLRSIRVYAGVPKSMYCSGMGGIGGLMSQPVVDWMYYLNDVIKPKAKKS